MSTVDVIPVYEEVSEVPVSVTVTVPLLTVIPERVSFVNTLRLVGERVVPEIFSREIHESDRDMSALHCNTTSSWSSHHRLPS